MACLHGINIIFSRKNRLGTHAAYLLVNVTATDLEWTAMNLQHEDIGAGIFLWTMISFLSMGLTVIGVWAFWG